MLDKIMASKIVEIKKLKKKEKKLIDEAKKNIKSRDFFKALTSRGLNIIAEVKKASPSQGLIIGDYHGIAGHNDDFTPEICL